MLDLANKVVLVTGGSRGIGAAVVEASAAAGAAVVLHYAKRRDAAERLAQALGPERCLPLAADLAHEAEVAALWQQAVAWKGGVDVLVNNAGIYEPAALDSELGDWTAAWRRTLQVNLIAPAQLCREAIRHYRGRGGGAIVNIGSRGSFRGEGADYAHYAASKGGLVALTRTVAQRHGADGVLAYLVAPGWVATDMAWDYLNEHGGADEIVAQIPLGEMTPPAEVANLVVFLASGKARHVSGAAIDINGASYTR